MGKRAHSRFTAGQKFIIWVVVIACAWHFLPLYTVVEGALLFLFGGEVPGTNIVLAPTTVMMIMGGLLLGGALFFLAKGIVHLFRDPAHHVASHNSDVPQTVGHQPTLAAVPVAVTSRVAQDAAHQQHYPIPQFALQAIVANLPEAIANASSEPLPEISDDSKLSRLWAALSPKLTSGITKSKTHGQNAWQKIQVLAVNIGHAAWICCVIAWIVGRRAARVAGKWIAKQSVAFWHWASPYLWQFDAWLGKQYLIGRKKFFKLYREIKRSIQKH